MSSLSAAKVSLAVSATVRGRASGTVKAFTHRVRRNFEWAWKHILPTVLPPDEQSDDEGDGGSGDGDGGASALGAAAGDKRSWSAMAMGDAAVGRLRKANEVRMDSGLRNSELAELLDAFQNVKDPAIVEPLDFWRRLDRPGKVPNGALMIRASFAVPACQVSCERLAGIIRRTLEVISSLFTQPHPTSSCSLKSVAYLTGT